MSSNGVIWSYSYVVYALLVSSPSLDAVMRHKGKATSIRSVFFFSVSNLLFKMLIYATFLNFVENPKAIQIQLFKCQYFSMNSINWSAFCIKSKTGAGSIVTLCNREWYHMVWVSDFFFRFSFWVKEKVMIFWYKNVFLF